MLANMVVLRHGQQAGLAMQHWQRAAGVGLSTKQQQQL